MKYNNKLNLMATVAISIALSSCSPLKPDHPQQFSDFKERRAPRDNQLASSGALSPDDKKKSGFTPYSGPEPKPENKASADVKSTSIANINKDGANDKSSSDKTDSGSFWDRLVKKFSSNQSSDSAKIASLSQRRVPKSNTIDAQKEVAETFGQGGGGGVSYYDIADDIIPSVPVDLVEQRPLVIKIAANSTVTQPTMPQPPINVNPSAPLVDIPEVPTKDQIKQQAPQPSKPELSQVPSRPEQFNKPLEPVTLPVENKPFKPMENTTNEVNKPVKMEDKPMVTEAKPTTEIKKTVEMKESETPQVIKKTTKKSIKKTSKKESKTKAHHHTEKHITAYNYHDEKVDYKDVVIQDQSARLMYDNGQPIVSGELNTQNE